MNIQWAFSLSPIRSNDQIASNKPEQVLIVAKTQRMIVCYSPNGEWRQLGVSQPKEVNGK